MTSIRVGIVEEHEIFRRGIVSSLSDDPSIEVTAEMETGPLPDDIDVAVVSQSAILKTHEPSYAIVVYGDVPHPPAKENERSARALLSRALLTGQQLTAAVRATAAGLQVENVGASAIDLDLDSRKLTILRQLSQGANTAEIARSLNYSDRTIKALIAAIEEDLDARTRAEAVAICIRTGLL